MIRWALAFVFALSSPVFAGTIVEIRMPIGTLGFELYDVDKPITVANFLNYISNGLYEDSFAHRLDPGFVLQGGGFYVDTAQTIPIQYIPTFPAILNEYSSGATYSNTIGTIAMARSSGVNSATSQWFVNLGNNAGLDTVNGGFTVFGTAIYAINGLGTPYASPYDFLNAINSAFSDADVSNYFVRHDFAEPLNELPVLYDPKTGSLPLNSLVFTEITVVPEPATALLLLLGLIPLYRYRRRLHA
jgi:cyclophilin family peptidyl-prolyl cis-trans isomerase